MSKLAEPRWQFEVPEGWTPRIYFDEEWEEMLKEDELIGETLEIAKRLDKAWNLGIWHKVDSD
jgi:hypothetical protein